MLVATTSHGPVTGLVCDDRAAVRRMVTALLLRCGYDETVAIDAAAALRGALDERRPTVAVVALPLLGMGGLTAVRDLLGPRPWLRLVLLSEFDELSGAAVEAGATALVPEDDPMLLQVHLLGVLASVDPSAAGPVSVALPGTGQVVLPSARSGAGTSAGTGSRRTNPDW